MISLQFSLGSNDSGVFAFRPIGIDAIRSNCKVGRDANRPIAGTALSPAARLLCQMGYSEGACCGQLRINGVVLQRQTQCYRTLFGDADGLCDPGGRWAQIVLVLGTL